MSRTRAIKPSFFDNDQLGELPPLTRLLFIGLWCEADREGRLEDRPKRLRKTLLGYDAVTDADVDAMLSSLHAAGFIRRYQVGDEHCIVVVNFAKHQNPHPKEKPSDIPAPAPAQLGVETVIAAGISDPHTASQGQDDVEVAPLHGKDVPLHGKDVPRHVQEMPLSIPSVIYSFCTPPTPPQSGGEDAPAAEPVEGQEERPREKTSERFALFWQAYPKKVGKGAAETAWRKLKPGAELVQTMLSAIAAAKKSSQWLRDGGQYIPNPATWLGQRRWEDEHVAPALAERRGHSRLPPAAANRESKYDEVDIIKRRMARQELEARNNRGEVQ